MTALSPAGPPLHDMVSRTLHKDLSKIPDYLVILTVLALVFSIYSLAAWFLLKPLLRRRGWTLKPDQPWLRRGVLSFAALGLLCLAYGWLWESRWVEVTHLRIPSAKLAPGASPIRILHVTDTHCDRWGSNEERLLEIARAEKPDLIVFTGDATNNAEEGFRAFRRLTESLQAPGGCYAVRGNWDVWFWSGLDLFGGSSFQELTVASPVRTVTIRGTRITVAGVPYDGDSGRALAALPPDALDILLYHTPDLIRAPETQDADFYLAGHTHEGQIRLPFYGALVTLSRYGKDYEAGLYQEGACRLYVCRGLGMEGGIAPRVRFCCRPEVAVIEIVLAPFSLAGGRGRR